MCRLLDIQPYVLRYWQTEFPALVPSGGEGDPDDFGAGELRTIRRIRDLLYDEGHTIASAKKKLAEELEAGRLHGEPRRSAGDDGPNGGPAQAVETEKPSVAASEQGAVDEAPVDEAPGETPRTGDIGVLVRRVERLEGGVAALVARARELAAELQPAPRAEDD